jgi:hypothetical protein
MDLTEGSPLLSSDLEVPSVSTSTISNTSGVMSFATSPAPQQPRAPSTVRTTQKHDVLSRPTSSTAQNSDHRDYKTNKDLSKPEEVSEYVHHGVDPSAPIYEITHAIPDALVLKCTDCQRFARGTQPFLSFPGVADQAGGLWRMISRRSTEEPVRCNSSLLEVSVLGADPLRCCE